MTADLSSINVGIITDDKEQKNTIYSALVAFGFRVSQSLSPDELEESIYSTDDVQLWIIDLVEQDKWDDLIEKMIEASPANLMFSDGNAPPVYSGKYPRWQKRLLNKIASLLQLGELEVPEKIAEERAQQIMANLKSIVDNIEEEPEEESGAGVAQQTDYGSIAKRVWVLGASLGGPAAVKLFLDALEPDLPIAFVLAQHIDEGFQALLGQVLGRNNHFELIKEFDRIQLRHGQILIAPADHAIKMDITRHICKTNDDWEGIYSPSINQVMRIVGEQYGPNSGAIIFSGMGDDSKDAAEYMSSVGGTIWAQTADTCANSSQPDSCRESGYVTYNGSPQQLAAKLMNTLKA